MIPQKQNKTIYSTHIRAYTLQIEANKNNVPQFDTSPTVEMSSVVQFKVCRNLKINSLFIASAVEYATLQLHRYITAYHGKLIFL